ncbi:MAG TPA: beta-ketoacyl synthase N-terminal-like domain-containing protein [Methylomusa anaerophila]|uniref:Polyketide synthase PksL n=1 Tax=Methylomusa anaerophila TaxID=1930071 RepID=A0A348AQQ8_9FIRM|nr:beta-ketoacyl synthase N-terminal-like domain-containing protein [Methylomusa anaerophila]BBB93406.1 polyketide synthase PksL [Methylomusa anaerophila]HML90354.1 beta-ketoacyl synthase N-terminal-like domain-containing protein [Methylomusa anaerophila]
MDNQIKILCEQIKAGKINHQDAAKQFMFLEAQRKQKIISQSSSVPGEEQAVPEVGEDLLRARTTSYLKTLLAAVIKLSARQIEADAPLEKYGVDSVMVLQLTGQLEKTFGTLPRTLLFEYQNIQELSRYFTENYREQLINILGIEEKAAASRRNVPEPAAATEVEKLAFRGRRRLRFPAPPIAAAAEQEIRALDIAIIGLAGRYPGAQNMQEFWHNLRDGRDCITEIPQDRWDYGLYFDADRGKAGKSYSKWGGFLEGMDRFDPRFFNISPREAKIMDPQERLFLECVYETLEDAGYTRGTLGQCRGFDLEGNVGVYAGVMYEEYQLYGAQEQSRGRPVALAGSPASIANRVSYFFDFHGPSMAVDTMCSSSLTAIHLACQSLRQGECGLAIAGGVNVSIHPNKYLYLAQGRFISSKGRCESFGQGGDGYVPGEGVGAVLLKPLSKAVADGDHIYGVIKGTAINHGGKTNGYTVPNPNAQASVIGRAFAKAGIDPRTISYLEAHGTGTSLGDPIEIAGLTKTFRQYTQDKQFCAIGSVKSNIGHCESAAGISGVTKVLLQLKYQQLAPSLHSQTLNPNIDFSNTPFVVQQEYAEWQRPLINGREIPRRAGVSSFGAGGSNAHVVIEEYITEDEQRPSIAITTQTPAIIVLSAKNEDQLYAQARNMLAAIDGQQLTDVNLADAAYTLQVGREAMDERLGMIVKSIKELREKLNNFLNGLGNSPDGVEELYRGQVKRNKEAFAVFIANEDNEDMVKMLAATVDTWMAKGNYTGLIDMWVRGLNIDWNKLYGGIKPRRISLPTYPFARERYWAPMTESKAAGNTTASPAVAALDKPASESAGRIQQSITLSLPGVSSPRSGDKAESIPMTRVPPAKSAELFQAELATSLAATLAMKVSDIDIDEKFIDMGLDSIVGVEWIREINAKYSTSIAATKVYDYPTIREFAGFLQQEASEPDRLKPDMETSAANFTPAKTAKVELPLLEAGAVELDKQTLSNPAISNPNRIPAKITLESIPLPLPAPEKEAVAPLPEANERPGQFHSSVASIAAESFAAESLQAELTTILARVLDLKPSDVDIDAKFIDIGLDSIVGVEWIQEINTRFGTSIIATKVYDYPTVREFAGFLEKELNKAGQRLDQAPSESSPVPSLQELVQLVRQGDINIEKANHIFQTIQLYETHN